MNKGEKAILMLKPVTYERSERSQGFASDVSKNFDVTQTTAMGRTISRKEYHEMSGMLSPEELLGAVRQRAMTTFVRGARPVKDLKYDILKHPNIALTEDGGAAPFLHGIADKADFSIQLTSAFLDHEDNQPAEPTGYELLSEEDLQHEFEEGESFND